jgi:hypothetical protein
MSHASEATLEQDLKEKEEQELDGIKEWVATNVGGKVVEIEALARWRPIWRVEYEKEGRTRSLFIKGDRPGTQPYSLEHEMKVMEVLEAHGIGVPHIHGWMDFPKAFVMDWVEGDRDPGMLHTAIENASSMSPERWRAMLKYMEELARMHRIPVSAFSETECGNPRTADEIALSQFERQYALGLEVGAVDANIEFFASWLRRNVPQHRTTASFLTGDCGQFMSKGEDITGIMDLEMAGAGDICWDLACFRGRHPYENMGDIPALYRHYAKVSGVELDLPVIGYHTVNFLAFAASCAIMFMDPKQPDSNWIEGILELTSISRRALEAMAELENVELDYDFELPEPADTPIEDMALAKLLLEIGRLPLSNAFPEWKRDLLAAIPRYLQNHAHYGGWYEQACLKDIEELTGERPKTMTAGEHVLKRYIRESGASHDASLIKLFHRKMLRLSMVVAGSNPSDENPLFFRLEPILNMPVESEPSK